MGNEFTIDTLTLFNMINNNRVAECELKRLKGLLDDKAEEQIKRRSYESLLNDIESDLTLWERLGVNNKIIGINDIKQTWITDVNGRTVSGYNLTKTGVIVALGKESNYVKMTVLKHFESLRKKALEQRAKECQQQEVKALETPKEEVKEVPKEVVKEVPKQEKPRKEEEIVKPNVTLMNALVGKIISWETICELNGWRKNGSREKYIETLEENYFVQVHHRKGYLLTRKTKEQIEQQKARKTSTKTRKVMATDVKRTYSIKFDSIKQAKEYFNFRDTSNISGACKHGNVAYNHYWKYLE